MSTDKTKVLRNNLCKGGKRRKIDKLVISVSDDGDKTLVWGKECVRKAMHCSNDGGGKIVVWAKRYAGKTVLYTKGNDGNIAMYDTKKTIRMHTDNPKVISPSANPIKRGGKR